MPNYSFERVVVQGKPTYIKVTTSACVTDSNEYEYRILSTAGLSIKLNKTEDCFDVLNNTGIRLCVKAEKVLLPTFTDTNELFDKLTEIFAPI